MGLLTEEPVLGTLPSDGYDKLLEAQELKEKKRLEWRMLKKGCFSSSEAHRLVTHASKEELPAGAITYVWEKVDEAMTIGVEDSYSSKAMDDGSEMEPESMEKFMEATGFKVEKYGEDQEFVKLGKDFGSTPDGLIVGINGGVEGKCPKSKTHIFYLDNIKNQEDLKKHRPAYYWQCQTGMLATGRDFWYWFSYCPRMKNENLRLLTIKIERNEADLEFFKARHQKAVALKNSIIRRLNA